MKKESLKEQEKQENKKYLHFLFNLFCHYTVLTAISALYSHIFQS